MKILPVNPAFTSNSQTQQTGQKHDMLNLFYEKALNQADMTDTLLVPRTIFKGYLGIMTGTTLITLGGVLKRFSRLSKTLTFTGLLASLYGTYAFVRPYILRGAKGVETKLPE